MRIRDRIMDVCYIDTQRLAWQVMVTMESYAIHAARSKHIAKLHNKY